MATAKQDARQVLDSLPEEDLLEDIQYHLDVVQRSGAAARTSVRGESFLRTRSSSGWPMSREVAWTETAWRDLERIADYIAEDSPGYAAAFVRRGPRSREIA